MYRKIYIIFYLLIGFSFSVMAQSDYQKTDSITRAQYERGEWRNLLNYGKILTSTNDDFPALRLRLADAAFNLGNYSLALKHYENVLNNDRFQQHALFYSILCNTYLNRTLGASYLTKNLSEKFINERVQKPFQFNSIGLENSFKSTDVTARGASTYTRLHVQLQVIENLHVDQSVFFFNQAIFTDKIRLSGYYIKLNYMPIKSLALLGAYNYNGSSTLLTSYQNQSAIVGIKYNRPYFSVQGDVNFSRLNDKSVRQINMQLFTNLSGNLNLYMVNRLSLLNSNTVYAGTLGTKLTKNVWVDAAGTFGKQENYVEADGLYQYNGIDNTTAKYVASAYFLIKKHLLLTVGYTLEDKESTSLGINYSQNAINTGIKWNF